VAGSAPSERLGVSPISSSSSPPSTMSV
jgi:hypothetical protein